MLFSSLYLPWIYSERYPAFIFIQVLYPTDYFERKQIAQRFSQGIEISHTPPPQKIEQSHYSLGAFMHLWTSVINFSGVCLMSVNLAGSHMKPYESMVS